MQIIQRGGKHMAKKTALKRRDWIYTQHPTVYGISCNYCGGTGIDWSEFEGRIWCHDCHCDVTGNGGIFNGPIQIEVCEMFGVRFDKLELRTGNILRMAIENNKIIWR